MTLGDVMDIRLGEEYINSVYYQNVKVWPMKCVPYTIPSDVSVIDYKRPILSECYIDASNIKTITFDNTIFTDYIATEIPKVQDNFTNTTPVLNFTNNVTEISLTGNGVENICITKYPIEGTDDFVYPNIETFYLDGSNNIQGCLFYGARNLKNVRITGLQNTLTSASMFDGCSKLENVEIDISTGSVTTQYMFRDCVNLKNVPLFNTHRVGHSGYMFYNCKSLLNVPPFDFSLNINMQNMFEGCTSLTTSPSFVIEEPFISGNGGPTNTSYMFKDCVSLTNVGKFLTTDTKYMQDMFEGCTSLTTIPNFDTRNVEDTRYMFNGCVSLNNIPILNMSKLKWASYMFNGCKKLQAVNLNNTENMTSADAMFYGCSSLTNLGLLKCSSLNLGQYNFMFQGCSSLANVEGFENLGMSFTYDGRLDLSASSILTKESCLNIFNTIADVSNKSYVFTIKLHPTVKNLVSSDIYIATNKGWVVQ